MRWRGAAGTCMDAMQRQLRGRRQAMSRSAYGVAAADVPMTELVSCCEHHELRWSQHPATSSAEGFTVPRRGRYLRQASARRCGRCSTRRYQAQRASCGPSAGEPVARRQGCRRRGLGCWRRGLGCRRRGLGCRRRGLDCSGKHALSGSCSKHRQSRAACCCRLQGSAAGLQLSRIRHQRTHADVAIG